MTWSKVGLVFSANAQFDWMQTHATVPTPFYIADDRYRVYFSTRDAYQRNQVGFVEFDLNNPSNILSISENPVLCLGDPGTFDCDGIYGTSIVSDGDRILFYYAGWNAGLRGQFFSALGVAESFDGGKKFHKVFKSPILGRDEIDPWACMAPTVIKRSSSEWVMFYASGIQLYYDAQGKIKSFYDIKSACSVDGIRWKKSGQSAVSLGNDTTNIARISAFQIGDHLYGFYPYINKQIGQYRIGFGIAGGDCIFSRYDDSEFAQIKPSLNNEDWDGKAVTYPYVFFHKDKMYMLYNGKEFGKTGFGLAVWEGKMLR